MTGHIKAGHLVTSKARITRLAFLYFLYRLYQWLRFKFARLQVKLGVCVPLTQRAVKAFLPALDIQAC